MDRWEKPEFSEIRMDAEISGYQQDEGPTPEAPYPTPSRTSQQLQRDHEVV